MHKIIEKSVANSKIIATFVVYQGESDTEKYDNDAIIGSLYSPMPTLALWYRTIFCPT